MKIRHFKKLILCLLSSVMALTACDDFFNWADERATEFGDWLGDAGEVAKDFGEDVAGTASDIIDQIYNWGSKTFDYIGNGAAYGGFVQFTTDAYGKAKDWIVENGQKAGDFAVGVKDGFMAFVLKNNSVSSINLTKKNSRIYGWEDYIGDPETIAIGQVSRYLEGDYNVFFGVIENEEDGLYYGLAFSDYTNPYYNKETGVTTYNTGFIALSENDTIPQELTDSGLEIRNIEGEKEDVRYVYTLDISPFKTHLLSGNQYITFGVNDSQTLFYSSVPYDGEYDESLGALYSFTNQEYVYGEGNEYIVISGSADQSVTSKSVKNEISNIMGNGFAMSVNTIYGYIMDAYRSVKNFFANLEDQTFLGYNVDDIKSYFSGDSVNFDDVITTNGNSIELKNNNPNGSYNDFVKWMIGIATAIIFVGNIAVRVVAFNIKDKRPILANAMLGASGAITAVAMDIFFETVINNKRFEDINWTKILIAAIAGAISSYTGIVLDALIAGVVQMTYSLMDGNSILQSVFSFLNAFVISLVIASIVGLLVKGISNAVGKIHEKIVVKSIAKSVKEEWGDTISDQAAKEIACQRYAAKALANGTADSILDSVDDVQRTFYKSLPSDDNPNIALFDDAHNQISKLDYYNSASKTCKMGLKDTASEEFKNAWIKSLSSLDEMLDVVNGEVQFEKAALAVAKFDANMLTSNREDNFKLFRNFIASEWSENNSKIPAKAMQYFNANNIDTNYLDEYDILAFQKFAKLTIHEAADGTMMLVSTDFHSKISHAGGVSLVKYLLAHSTYYASIRKGVRT